MSRRSVYFVVCLLEILYLLNYVRVYNIMYYIIMYVL